MYTVPFKYTQRISEIENNIAKLEEIHNTTQATKITRSLEREVYIEEAKSIEKDLNAIEKCISATAQVIMRLPEKMTPLFDSLNILHSEKKKMDMNLKITKTRIRNIELGANWYLSCIRTEMRYMEVFKLRLAEAQANKDIKNGISLAKLKKRIPTDILTYIGEFLPYKTRFYLLNRRYNTFNRLEKLLPSAINALYDKVIATPGLLDALSGLSANQYRQYAVRTYHREDERKPLLISLIYHMKTHCPDHALRLMKELIILINPRKRYSAKR